MASDLTNLPTVGADNDSWGTELNAALTELDTKKASAAEVYTKTAADARYVRTVNGTAPDASGDVAVSGGGGGTFSGVPDDGSVTDAKIAPGGLSPSKITGTAITNSDSRLTDTRTPKTHASTHATGGTDPITAANIGAIPTASRGAASGVAPLGVDSKISTDYLPGIAYSGGASFKVWVQADEPTTGVSDGDVWIKTP